ncbi:MAG: hypothetical protein WCK92_08015 [Bacteroidota bacterium]
MEKESLLKRLSIVKLLYKIGIEQSRQSESTAFLSILSFHNSVEMFLVLVCENDPNVKMSGDKNFMSYWEKVPQLSMSSSMRKLNELRNGIKHKGIIPVFQEVTDVRLSTTKFLNENSKIFFDVDFQDITLFHLIKFEETRNHLIRGNENLVKNDLDRCVNEVSNGFYKLLDHYKETKKSEDDKSEFDFISTIHLDNPSYSENMDRKVYDSMKDVILKINQNFCNVGKALEVLSLGLDYRKFAKFRMLTPSYVYKDDDGNYIFGDTTKKTVNKDYCQFLIDFATDSCLRLQDFDFSYDPLDSLNLSDTFPE